MDGATGQASAADDEIDDITRLHRPLGGIRDVDPRIVAGHADLVDARQHDRLDLCEIDPLAHNLHKATATSDDVQPCGVVEVTEVAGTQRIDVAATDEVPAGGGVAEHDVRSAVDDLTDTGSELGGLRDLLIDLEGAAGQRATHRSIGTVQLRGCQHAHPCGRLGLPVHHVQVPPVASAGGGHLAGLLGRQPAAGDGESADAR